MPKNFAPDLLLRGIAARRQVAKGGDTMAKLLGFVGSLVGSSIGWWLGAFAGTMTAFMLSMVGTGVGIYLGRRIAAEWG